MASQTARARALRQSGTEAEHLLWPRLRNRRSAGFKFRRQKPVGNRIVDFLCAEKKLAIELDGSGHGYPTRQRYDADRSCQLNETGIRVIRFWNSEVLRDVDWVLDAILLKLDPEKSRWTHVKPSPPSSPSRERRIRRRPDQVRGNKRSCNDL